MTDTPKSPTTIRNILLPTSYKIDQIVTLLYNTFSALPEKVLMMKKMMLVKPIFVVSVLQLINEASAYSPCK